MDIGEKLTLAAHAVPVPESVAPAQLFVCVKSPLTEMLAMLNLPLPEFVIVTVWVDVLCPTAVSAKLSVADESRIPGGASPVPESATACDRNWSDTVSVPV